MQTIQLLLADDDNDDCMLFQEALSELHYNINLSIVNDGEELMNFLKEHRNFSGILFLDLNMPRKNGIECLTEIKLNEQLMPLKLPFGISILPQENLKEMKGFTIGLANPAMKYLTLVFYWIK